MTLMIKIVALHKTKRDFADSLLSDTDVSGKLSADEGTVKNFLVGLTGL